nr:rod shape-determining protein MreD [Streptococcus loxodontisalivarius]
MLVLVFALFLLLFDGQFGQFLTQLSGRDFIFVSHFLLYYLIYLYARGTDSNIITASFIIVFLIADLYYLNFIGIYLLALLFSLSLLHLVKKDYLKHSFYAGLTFFLVCFFFDFVSYGLALLFGLSRLSLFTFVTYSLAPSLLLNVVIYLVLLFVPKTAKK